MNPSSSLRENSKFAAWECVQKYDQGFRFQCVFTSTWLGRVLTNLNPGILLSLHTTPTSSVCLQSDTPIPLEGHRAKVLSLPLQWRLSNQMGPEPDKREIHQFFPREEFFPFSSGNNKGK